MGPASAPATARRVKSRPGSPDCRLLPADLSDGDEQENDADEDPESNQDLAFHATIHGERAALIKGGTEIPRRKRPEFLAHDGRLCLLRSVKLPVFVKTGATYTNRLLRRHRWSHFFLRFSNSRLMSDCAFRKRSLALACTSRM